MTDIHNNPSQYLNGTAPLNVTGYATECNASGQDCVGLSSPDSYMWFDPLHVSTITRLTAGEPQAYTHVGTVLTRLLS